MEGKKELIMTIDVEDLRTLKEGQYELCIAKQFNGEEYSRVWSHTGSFLSINNFVWYPRYQMYASNTKMNNVIQDARTVSQDILPGQRCTLDEYGLLSDAETGSAPDALEFVNCYSPIFLNIAQYCNDINGDQKYRTMYTSAGQFIQGQYQLKQSDKIIVWFQHRRTDSAIDRIAQEIELDFSSRDTASVHYTNGVWFIN